MRTTLLALLAATALALAACGGDDSPPAPAEEPAPAAAESSAPTDAPGDGYTAQSLVDELESLYPLPNARDNTSGCQNDHENDCVQRITTDLMTVTEFPDEDIAAHWVEGMADTGDARQAGRFMLLWHEDSMQSDEARDELHARAQELVG